MNDNMPRSGESSSAGGDVRDTVRQKAATLAHDAKEQAREQYDRQKGAARGELSSLASALRRAGSELGDEHGTSSRVVTTVADRIDSFSRSLEGKDLDRVVRDVETFARRNPAAFLGGAVALGFIASRFLKSESTGSSGRSGLYGQGEDGAYFGGSGLDRSSGYGTRTYGIDHSTEREFGTTRPDIDTTTRPAGTLPTPGSAGPATGVSGTLGSTGSVTTPGTIATSDETRNDPGRGRR